MSTPILRPEAVRSNHLPFAALPHALNEDPRLTPRAVRVAAAVLKHARDAAACSPSNRTLAAACRCCVRTVQYALAELRAAGWITLERGPAGRVIRLAWRAAPPCNGVRDPVQPPAPPPCNGVRDPVQRAAPPPCNGLHPKEKTGEGEERNVTDLPPPEDAASPGPRPGPATAPRPAAPVRPLLEELKALPGADEPRVRSLAWRLAHHLADVASVAFFALALRLVAAGSVPLQRLLDAFRVADRSRGKARRPGAIFASAWSSWTPPPLPSEIRYPQQPTPPAAPDRTGPPPMDRAHAIRELTLMANDPRHPFRGVARARLAELGVEVPAEAHPADPATGP
ncbi:MAG: helix-turn-helix domain-containing protein [Singulisphaera sp.]|nr:helix-turn-helix domain-containing protein [Singulisphaera sp.]